MNKDRVHTVIGELLIKEKYKYLPNGLLGEICRDFVEGYFDEQLVEESPTIKSRTEDALRG